MASESKGEYRGTTQEFTDARGKKYYRARITLPDGERVWLKPRFPTRKRAEEYAHEKTVEAEKRGLTLEKMSAADGGAKETCDDYFGRLSEARESEGIKGVRKSATTGRGGSARASASARSSR